jgi:Rrf2 family protein
MKISLSAGYALLAIVHIMKNKDQDIIMSKKISDEYKISPEYLHKILQQLVRANILRSKRGPTGGFYLAKGAKNTNMLQVIEAVDGPLEAASYLFDEPPKQKFSRNAEKKFGEAIKAYKAVLAKQKIANLLR